MEHFGTTGDGREVHAISLGAPGALQAQILTYGGILRRLTFPSHGAQRDLVLTLPHLDAYVRHGVSAFWSAASQTESRTRNSN
jgi:galactose mutarotase-like enzyme